MRFAWLGHGTISSIGSLHIKFVDLSALLVSIQPTIPIVPLSIYRMFYLLVYYSTGITMDSVVFVNESGLCYWCINLRNLHVSIALGHEYDQ